MASQLLDLELSTNSLTIRPSAPRIDNQRSTIDNSLVLQLKTLLLTFVTIYLTILSLAYLFSSKLIFFPPKTGYHDDENIIKLKTADGALISAVYLPNAYAKYTILVSHGNAEDLGYMEPFLIEMQQQGFSVFAYDYHGYGTSQGAANELHSYADIDAAYNYLTQNRRIASQNIVLYGRSLGAAVALDLAARKPVAAVILEAPFVTAYRVLTTFPILPFDQFDNLTKIKKLKIPLLFIHGERDEVIPIWHSKKLYKEAVTANKQYYLVSNAKHNDVLWQAQEKYWQAIVNFIKSI